MNPTIVLEDTKKYCIDVLAELLINDQPHIDIHIDNITEIIDPIIVIKQRVIKQEGNNNITITKLMNGTKLKITNVTLETLNMTVYKDISD